MKPPPTTASRGSLLVVFLTVFVDLLGFGIVMPLLPLYGKAFGVDGLMLGLLMASFSLMQFLFAPVWGRLSDRIGRRPVLIVGLLGSTICYALFGVASIYGNIWMLFITRIGAGIAGATIPTAQAYIADCTTAESRTKGMALIGAAFGLGFTFGPLLAWGALISSIGPAGYEQSAPDAIVLNGRLLTEDDKELADNLHAWNNAYHVATNPWPGFVASTTSGISLLLAIFLLPESLQPGNRTPAGRKLFDSEGWRIAWNTPTMPALLLTVFVSVFSFGGFEATLSLFLASKSLPFKFEIYQIPLFFAFIGVVLMIVQGGIVRRLSSRVSDIKLCLVGCGITILGFALLVSAIYVGQLWYLLFATAVEVSGFAFITPTINGLISRRTDPAHQGNMMGISQSVSSMARIIGPPVAMPLFTLTPLAPYAVAIVGMLIVVALMVTVVPKGMDFTSKGTEK